MPRRQEPRLSAAELGRNLLLALAATLVALLMIEAGMRVYHAYVKVHDAIGQPEGGDIHARVLAEGVRHGFTPLDLLPTSRDGGRPT